MKLSKARMFGQNRRERTSFPNIVTDALRRVVLPSAVLYFHGVVPTLDDRRVQTLHFETDTFVALLRNIGRHCDFMPLSAYGDFIAGKRPRKRPVVFLTSDDGYQNNLHTALPLLQEMGIPLATFVSTDHISKGIRFPTYIMRCFLYYASKGEYRLPHIAGKVLVDHSESSKHWNGVIGQRLKSIRLDQVHDVIAAMTDIIGHSQMLELDDRFCSDRPLTWLEVDQLEKQGVIIGAHAMHHAILHANEEHAVVREQIFGSVDVLRQRYGLCQYLSYPSGSTRAVSAQALLSARQSGAQLAFTTHGGTIAASLDAQLIPRVHLSPLGRRNTARLYTSWRDDRALRAWQRSLVRQMDMLSAS